MGWGLFEMGVRSLEIWDFFFGACVEAETRKGKRRYMTGEMGNRVC